MIKNEKTGETELVLFPEKPDPHFHPSPIMRIRVANETETIAMNRKDRRRNKLYGKLGKVE